ncbi:PLP-dependent transferase [Pigmentiphaga aceris]|uniref:PLP-dependent transferase n=1 Tax=Pigmentiphaga aceris TaxID=1940612 RepID=A0A5C0AVF3_9BURK|nr:PLP-dependent aspartate aminotransferase family protein [Pigmentiphaga aceris]QEI05686.1 PLP-dependent transferase [Pigmentiphaga aceris]
MQSFSSLVPPVMRASTVKFASLEDFVTRGSRLPDGFSYGTTGTPTHRQLESRIAALDGGAHCVVVPSGQAAVALVMMALLKSGDHLLISDSSYGPAQTFALEHMATLGVIVERYDPCIDGDTFGTLIRPATKLIWMESPGSITMEVQDVEAIVAQARKHGVLTAIDNTWSSPLYFQPLTLGVDLCIHACTKYMGGHSDLLMGSISANDFELYRRMRHLQSYMGLASSADDCFLVERGLETLALRMAHQSAVALDLAAWLETQDCVQQVLHPALKSSPSHALWQRYFTGSGGVFSMALTPAPVDAYKALFDDLQTFSIGASWGSVHSLIAYYPAQIQDSRAFPLVRTPLVRVSVGLEGAERLREDLDRALRRFQAVAAASPQQA